MILPVSRVNIMVLFIKMEKVSKMTVTLAPARTERLVVLLWVVLEIYRIRN